MPMFKVYQQKFPRAYEVASRKGEKSIEWAPVLAMVGSVHAPSGADAIESARATFIEFKIAKKSTLAAYPVVEQV